MPLPGEIRQLTLDDFESAVGAAYCYRYHYAKCQALAEVARYGPERRAVEIAWRALEAAQDGSDPYQRVWPAAWPLRALIERDLFEPAKRMLKTVLPQAQEITPMSSRSKALLMHFQAVAIGPDRLWRQTFGALVDACVPVEHWRQGRNLRDGVLIVAALDASLAREAVERLDDGKLKRKLLRKLDAGETREPRDFFYV